MSEEEEKEENKQGDVVSWLAAFKPMEEREKEEP